MQFDLQETLKALLFSTSEPITTKGLKDIIQRYRTNLEEELKKANEEDKSTIDKLLEKYPKSIDINNIEEALKAIETDLKERGEFYRLLEGPNGYSLALAPEYAPWIRLLRNEDKPIKLSPATMETLALIAYRQPITRAEIELIRGVSADAGIQKLIEYNLIYVQGQANLPGKPRLYATSEDFLSFCGIKCLEDLPASDVLPAQKVTQWVQEEGKREIYSNQEMGLE